MYLFLFFNFFIFDILGITLSSFQVAGGILLFLLGLQMALGIDIGRTKEHTPTAAGVIIGTPLLCGPGTITSVLLLAEANGMFITAAAIALVLAATWIVAQVLVPDTEDPWSLCDRNPCQDPWDACRGDRR